MEIGSYLSRGGLLGCMGKGDRIAGAILASCAPEAAKWRLAGVRILSGLRGGSELAVGGFGAVLALVVMFRNAGRDCEIGCTRKVKCGAEQDGAEG